MLKSVVGFALCVLFTWTSLEAQQVYKKPPKDFKSKMQVAVCFIKVKDRVLFLKRQFYKPQPNTWGIPGGKLDPGEKAETAVVREVGEETGIELQKDNLEYLGKVFVRYPSGDYTLYLYSSELEEMPESVDISPNEHRDYKWMTFTEAEKYPLIPGEDEIIDMVYGQTAES